MPDHDLDRPLARAARLSPTDVTPMCLDAEALAAWTDGTLRPAERAAAETHVADCGRCLALLAAMARTAPLPEATRQASWFSLRWLVPLATAAVAVTVWVTVRDPKLIPPPVLQDLAAPATPPPASAAAPPSEAAKQNAGATPVERDQRQERRERKERGRTATAAEESTAGSASGALSRQAEAQDQRQTMAAPPSPPTPSARADALGELAAQRSAAAGSLIVATPDPAVQWRLAGREIQRTTDRGQTWQTQFIAAADLVGGSAPAAGIGWVVGRAGLVLRAVDGETWQPLVFPVTADLATVTAADAQSAAVTTADGRTYRTADGGRTWTLQEKRAAPF